MPKPVIKERRCGYQPRETREEKQKGSICRDFYIMIIRGRNFLHDIYMMIILCSAADIVLNG
jgi:hypothetical protein